MAATQRNGANRWMPRACATILFALAAGGSGPLGAQVPPPAADASAAEIPTMATYADLAELVGKSRIVAVVEVTDQAAVEPERSPGLAPGSVRLYLESEANAVLFGSAPLGASQVFLADLPLSERGRAPKVKDRRFLIFANPVEGRRGALQLVEPDAMLPAEPALEQRVRTVISQSAAADAPPSVTGVREAFSIAGNLAGESETQVFLDTANGDPVSLTVVRRPGMEPQWGVSWTEIVDQSAQPPEPETMAWYRLACFLPPALPDEANSQSDRASRMQAEADYRYIVQQLGPCERVRKKPPSTL